MTEFFLPAGILNSCEWNYEHSRLKTFSSSQSSSLFCYLTGCDWHWSWLQYNVQVEKSWSWHSCGCSLTDKVGFLCQDPSLIQYGAFIYHTTVGPPTMLNQMCILGMLMSGPHSNPFVMFHGLFPSSFCNVAANIILLAVMRVFTSRILHCNKMINVIHFHYQWF